jgi:hypothetical protein
MNEECFEHTRVPHSVREREKEERKERKRKEREKEGGRERKREGARDRERERENLDALSLFLAGMTGASAPSSYLVTL